VDGGAEGLPMHPPFRLEVTYSTVQVTPRRTAVTQSIRREAYRLTASVHHGSVTHHPSPTDPSESVLLLSTTSFADGYHPVKIRFLNNVTCNKSYHKVLSFYYYHPR